MRRTNMRDCIVCSFAPLSFSVAAGMIPLSHCTGFFCSTTSIGACRNLFCLGNRVPFLQNRCSGQERRPERKRASCYRVCSGAVLQLAMATDDELCIYQTKDALAARLSKEILSLVQDSRGLQASENEQVFVVAVSGGSMPSLLRTALSDQPEANTRLSRALWILVDERVVPRDHPDSNFRAVRDALEGLVCSERILGFPPDSIALDTSSIADAYAELLRSKGIKPENIDLVLLGMGEDGHTASLFPNDEANLRSAPEAKFYIGIDNSPKPPPRRITLSMTAIQAAKRRIFVVTGEGKAKALAHIFQEGNTKRLPAGLVQNALWLVDADAASEISYR